MTLLHRRSCPASAGPEAQRRTYCALQAKLAASSELPVPV